MTKIFITVALLLQQIFSLFPFPVHAGGLYDSKVTITDSRPSHAGTDHTFSFTTANLGTIASITFEYCTSSTGTCTVPTGLVTTGASQGAVTGIGTSTSNFTSNGTIYLNVTSPISIPSGTAITVPYANVTNPSTANSSYYVIISTRDGLGDVIDTTAVAFATLSADSLTITADVGATLQTDIQPVTSGAVNGEQINLTDTTSSTIPFGILSAGSSKVAAHDVTVLTNAGNGYQISVRASSPPMTSGSNNIDTFTGINASPTLWTAPSGTSENVNTGFIGYTTEDTSLCTGTPNRFSTNLWAGPETTPFEIICNQSPTSGAETTRIGWRAQVNNLQPSGSYTAVFFLVITPTY